MLNFLESPFPPLPDTMSAETAPRILLAGDKAIVVEFSDRIDDAVNASVVSLAGSYHTACPVGVTEVVPTYRSLLICYEPEMISAADIVKELSTRLALPSAEISAGRLWDFPVVYGGVAGVDLPELAASKGMSETAVIALHSSVEYRVHMIGFAPGYAYLGGLQYPLHTPRRSAPRQKVEAGVIAIGGRQTSISSVSMPSGWQLIGRTPVSTFDLNRQMPFLLKAGDRVRFHSVTQEEADDIGQRLADGAVFETARLISR